MTVYRHYKGGRYLVLFEAEVATNGMDEGGRVVVYVSLTNGRIFVRDHAEFHGYVNEKNEKRFEVER